jgi:hypothetical protein
VAPAHVGDRVIDVVEEDLPDPGAPLREARAPVGEPAVVRADAGEAQLVLLGHRRARDDRARREERRDRVGERHLRDDAVGLLLRDPPFVVPVLRAPARLQVLERVAVSAAPAVEVVEVPLLEVRAVHLVVAAGVAVGGDQGQTLAHGRNASAVCQM